MLLLYILIAVGGFLLFGDAVERNVLENLPHSNFKTIIGILMAFHVSAALLIVINPVNIALEEAIRMKGKLNFLCNCRVCTFNCRVLCCRKTSIACKMHFTQFGWLIDDMHRINDTQV